ncbi:hypothetical protein [Actinacidiphila rubida]|uniref:Uncharacterized protein n=1 Tax=Actinacidiphila rubida TaxID=310780 RepID=A0A1H8GQ31_9ACTN|nr:hypothetical protein [Actinacidiphila rubida]SEN45388.1 hypothetical protein SAMN05216267_1005188 [Actinacidiphila rubida]
MGHALDTDLRPGETLVANCAVEFPSGQYKRVWGFRSFRDSQGRDISAELPGWPPSSKPAEPPAKGSAKGVLLASAWFAGETLAVGLAIAGLGAQTATSPDPEDRDDYAVLRADPGTLALRAPWQLDPGRNEATPRVILHVTNQRLLLTDPATGALLWAIRRQDIASMDERGTLLRFTFVDGSWIRIVLAKDKDALIADSEKYYTTKMVKGEPTRVSLTSEPRLKFVGTLNEFLAASPSESE